MLTIAIANQKGGVGKTTTAVTLAHGLALKGHRTWLLDMDPQGQVSLALGVAAGPGISRLLLDEEPAPEVLTVSGRPRLWVIPGNKRTARILPVMGSERWPLDTLARAIRPRGDGAPAFVVIDTPPGVGGLQELALFEADVVIVPCQATFLASDGVNKVLETMGVLQQAGWAGRLLGVLPTFYDESTRESKATLADLQETLGPARVLTPVHKATVLADCAGQGKTIWEVDPNGRPAREYAALTWAILRRGNGHGAA